MIRSTTLSGGLKLGPGREAGAREPDSWAVRLLARSSWARATSRVATYNRARTGGFRSTYFLLERHKWEVGAVPSNARKAAETAEKARKSGTRGLDGPREQG